MYKEPVFGIHFEPVDPGEELECAEYLKLAPHNYRTLYTRLGTEQRVRTERGQAELDQREQVSWLVFL